MRRVQILVVLMLGTAFWPWAVIAADHPLKGVALVIGESDYASIQKLDNPKRDARAMDDLLDGLGFSVERVLDGDAEKLRAAIADFIDEAKDADVALVYYSGHGVEAAGSDYLVPVDADLSTPESAGQGLVPVAHLLDELAKTVPVTIVLLDACRTNSFPEGQLVLLPGTDAPVPVAEAGLEALRGPQPVARPDVSPDSLGMVVGFAASPGQPALDGEPGGNSPYAAALLKHFGAGGYSIGDLMTMVSEEVYLKTRAKQLPWTNSSLRRVLSFGTPATEPTGDEGAIREGRRQLLLTIATAPETTRRYVETVAASEDVPLDALYGMLKVLGVDTSGGSEDIEHQLLAGAQQLKDFMARVPGAAKSDPELIRLSGLADHAETEGAIDLALKFRREASARADTLDAAVDENEANLKADRLQIGETYADHAKTAALNFDFAASAEMWSKAFGQVEKWDDALALTYKWNEASALADHGEYKGDNAALEKAIDLYEDAAALAPAKSSDWAAIRTGAGNALEILGQRKSTTDGLEAAIKAYEDALTVQTREAAPVEWARIQGNIGVALTHLSDREQGTASLERARAAFEGSLEELTREAAPLDWAKMQSNLGNVLQLLGDRTGDGSLYQDAVVARQAALEELTRDRVPMDWANAETNLGQALARLGELEEGTDSLEAALAAFNAALEIRTRDKLPLEWAATQDNIGSATATIGRRLQSTDRMHDAISAFSLSLEERTRERSPVDWASTTRNRGVASKKLGEMTEGTQWFDRAIADYQAALEVFTRDVSPLDWAQTQADIGIVALARAKRTGAIADLEMARDAYASAYEIYGAMGDDYAKYFEGKIDEIDQQLGGA